MSFQRMQIVFGWNYHCKFSLGHANIVAKGHGATGAEVAYSRALYLCKMLGDVPEHLATLFGLWRFYVVARPFERHQ